MKSIIVPISKRNKDWEVIGRIKAQRLQSVNWERLKTKERRKVKDCPFVCVHIYSERLKT